MGQNMSRFTFEVCIEYENIGRLAHLYECRILINLCFIFCDFIIIFTGFKSIISFFFLTKVLKIQWGLFVTVVVCSVSSSLLQTV